MKVLTIDIETRPSLGYVWSLWKQNVGLTQLVETGEVISFAAKWHGKKNVMFHSVYHDGKEGMIKAAWELLDEADIVVHYNGKSFDIPHLQREFLLGGYNPPAPFQQVDLLHVMRKQFKFVSNKLDHIVQQLDLGAKTSHTGFQLWVDCLAGDAKAWALMRKYNKHDVVITESLYDRVQPWITGHPTVGLYSGMADVCPSCGSGSLQMRGYAHTKMSTFQRFVCNDCGKWSRSNKRESSSNVVSL